MIRHAGVALLGFLGGAFTGVALTDLLAWVTFKDAGPDTTFPLGPAVGILTPALGVAGALIALALDRRRQRRHPSR